MPERCPICDTELVHYYCPTCKRRVRDEILECEIETYCNAIKGWQRVNAELKAENEKLKAKYEGLKRAWQAASNVVDTYAPKASATHMLHDKVFWLGRQYEQLKAENETLKVDNERMKAKNARTYRVCKCGCLVHGTLEHPCDKCGSLEYKNIEIAWGEMLAENEQLKAFIDLLQRKMSDLYPPEATAKVKKCPKCGNHLIEPSSANSRWWCSDCELMFTIDAPEATAKVKK